MPRSRLDSLKQVQRRIAGRSYAYQYSENPTPSPSIETLVEVDEEDEESKADNRLKAFLDNVEEIYNSLKELKVEIEALKRTQSDILNSPNSNDPILRSELDSLMSKIDRHTNQIRSWLKVVEQDVLKEEDVGSARYRIKQTQHSSLLYVFMNAVEDYLTAQATYKDRCKDKLKRQLGISGTRVSMMRDDEIEKLMDEEQWNVFTKEVISEPKITKQMMVEIEERHEDIMKLEKSIVELHKIFTQMAILIEAQGEMVDRIENHVELAREITEETKVILKEALVYQSRSRKKQVILGAILGAVALIVIVVIVCAFI